MMRKTILLLALVIACSFSVSADPFSDPSLILYYPMDENFGSALHDMSSGDTEGTIVGAQRVAGIKNNALQFPLNTHVTIPATYLTDIGQAQTASWWVNRANNGVVYSARGPGQEWFYAVADGVLSGFGSNRIFTPPSSLSANTWHHFAYTFDGTTLTAYHNGVSIGTATPTFPTGAFSVDSMLGKRNGGSSIAFTGLIDEFAVWSRVLSAAEILDVYNDGLTPGPPNVPPPDPTPPLTPQSLAVQSTTFSGASLTWAASSDPETGIDSYRVYRDGVQVGSTSATNFFDSGLTEQTSYNYEVTAINGQGMESAKSTVAVATTQAAPVLHDSGRNDPILLFSDMDSAPNVGWDGSPTKGAAVTIWGYNLGNTRGSSYVTVNGVDLNAESDYAVWGEYFPTKFWQRITFWLNDQMATGTGTITVTVNGVTSNPLEFTVRPDGRILFVTKNNPGGTGTLANKLSAADFDTGTNWRTAVQPGDVYYFDDAQTYDMSLPGHFRSLFYVPRGHDGTATHPIAFISHPGDKPLIDIPLWDEWKAIGFRLQSDYYTVSGFTLDVEHTPIMASADYQRVIGNDMKGLKSYHGQGSGMLSTGNSATHEGSGTFLLGNAIHGGRSANKLDHAIYVSGCSSEEGVYVGWNHVYDHDFNRGPLVQVNHQENQNRCDVGQIVDSHYVFNNVVECSDRRARAIGINDIGYTVGEQPPEPTYVYNNVVIDCGVSENPVGAAPAMYGNNGLLRFYNNILYNTGHIGLNIGGGSRLLDVQIKNNIFHMNPTVAGEDTYVKINSGDESKVSMSNNLYYGSASSYDPCTDCNSADTGNVFGDPLFINPSADDFRLQPTSPAVDASADISFEVPPRNFALINRDLDYMLRTGNWDLGPYHSPYTNTGLNSVNATPVIVSTFPPSLNRMNKSATRAFNVTATDADGDVLQITWTMNGSVVGNGQSYALVGNGVELGKYNLTVTVTDGNTQASRTWHLKLRTPKKQDINDDDIVDVKDLRIVAKHVIKKKAWRAQYDQNNDGIVNIFDLISIIQSWGPY